MDRIRRCLQIVSLGGFILMNGVTTAGDESKRTKPIFTLTKGQGVEVCEAYLPRLNATEYVDNDPRKGRLKEPEMPGFIDLKPVPLSLEEIQDVILKGDGFLNFQDQDFYNKQNFTNEQLKWLGYKVIHGVIEIKPENLLARVKKQKLPMMHFLSPVDIDNDSVPDILVANWLGSSPNIRMADSGDMVSMIFDKNTNRVDETKMRDVFGHSEWVDWPTVIGFPSLVAPVYVFNYQGRYYFDGLFNQFQGDLVGERRFLRSLDFTMGVFLHERGKTRQVCEYYWSNWDIDFKG
jgi:hypothetical protein